MSTPGHYSHSQVSSWLRCGKAYQLERLVGVPRNPAVYLVTGNAIHSVIERLNRRAYDDLCHPVTSDMSHMRLQDGDNND